MAPKRKYAHKKPIMGVRDFPAVEGTVQDIDERIAYVPEETDWNNYVMWSDDVNDMVVPHSVVVNIMNENDELRNTLYTHTNSTQARAIRTIEQLTGHSTSEVIQLVNNIEFSTRKAVPSQEVFRWIYDIIDRWWGLDLKWRKKDESKLQYLWKRLKKDESKLQYLWRTGWLPVVSIIASLAGHLISSMRMAAPKEFDAWINAVVKKRKPNKKKPKNISF
jgi:hypothetical protein